MAKDQSSFHTSDTLWISRLVPFRYIVSAAGIGTGYTLLPQSAPRLRHPISRLSLFSTKRFSLSQKTNGHGAPEGKEQGAAVIPAISMEEGQPLGLWVKGMLDEGVLYTDGNYLMGLAFWMDRN
ncbi:hypothetical protein SELMODRAFT_408045 [Selaginella moellendorffii]|uniref:Uncharacterized protein n=1 Tax=Selaginella moellendorffii TaxID=88036 RepID=D8R711_SELML|nr:hypothetical protein SELMODRAFT_408045 [Selaginella moellendorffii]